ncbi:MAG: MFS transporter [Bryobacteraceae bacterium]|nr:MFS transporter [Bryobacteraceae bacterium]
MTEASLRRGRLEAQACAGMFLFGIVMALLGACLPLLARRLAFDLAQAGDLFLAMNGAMLAASIVSGPLMDRKGTKPLLVAGPFLVAGALALVAGAGSYAELAAALALLGAGGGAINAGANTLMADLFDEPRRKNSAMNRLGIFFGFGALLLPFGIGALIEAVGLVPLLAGCAALSALAGASSAPTTFPRAKARETLPFRQLLRLARSPLVLAFGLLLFFQSGNEFILGGYITTLLTRELGATVATASYVLAGYWAALMLARVLASRWLLRVSGHKFVLACAAGAAVFSWLMSEAPSRGMAAAATVMAGFCLAGIFPTVLGLAGAQFKERTGAVFGILFAMALTGGMTQPWLVGRLAENYGVRAALKWPAGCFAAIVLLELLAARLGRAAEPGGSPPSKTQTGRRPRVR